jgi:hypothetical protein
VRFAIFTGIPLCLKGVTPKLKRQKSTKNQPIPTRQKTITKTIYSTPQPYHPFFRVRFLRNVLQT